MPKSSFDDQVAFGAEVRRRRLAARWTLEQLAARARISANYLGAIERGLRDPSLSTVEALAGGLGVTVGELLGGAALALTPVAVAMAREFAEAPERLQVSLLQILRVAAAPPGGSARTRKKRR